MPYVTLTLDGHSYRMACAEGEDEHLQDLGALMEARIQSLRQRFGEMGDRRLLLMAALTFVDEGMEAKKKIEHLEQALLESRTAFVLQEKKMQGDMIHVAQGMVEKAKQIENLVHFMHKITQEEETL